VLAWGGPAPRTDMATTLFLQAQRYVGTPYLPGVYDCADLAAKVQHEVFGRVIALPDHRARPAGARGQAREVLGLRDKLAERVELPADGHAVLLWEPDGEAGQNLRIWHVGTVFMHAGEIWVLHNSAKLGSAALHRLADLRRWGMRLDGFYAWKDAA